MPISTATDSVINAFSRLRVWERGDIRAPHKPLLALLTLGYWANKNRGPWCFAEIEKPLRDMLMEFGPSRKSYHPEFPFWHLQTDGVWEVSPKTGYPSRKGHTSPSAKQLRDAGATGQFSHFVRAAFESNPSLVAVVARQLLDAHFPPTYHEDILSAVGLELETQVVTKLARDPAFREAVLVAYGYACAICGVGIRLGHVPVGLEAAHIRWHASGGPDVVMNGLSLCSLHHKLFDRGVMTLSVDGATVWVSEHANGINIEEALLRYHQRPIAKPSRADGLPRSEFVGWHHKEVFKGRPRSEQTSG